MGSLMAGWDSPVLGDDNKVRSMRNRSLTNEEVEAFWKQHNRKPAPEKDGEIGTSPLASPGATAKNDADVDAEESPSKSRDWWTRSNWAFLNEPPQEAPSKAQNYTPQFHVARIATGNT